jgi:hypothetical protein
MFCVALWHSVTVALRLISSSATGMPTMLLRPMTAARRPEMRVLVRSSSSMQPSGVQGTNSGSRPCVQDTRCRCHAQCLSAESSIWQARSSSSMHPMRCAGHKQRLTPGKEILERQCSSKPCKI